jgi:type II secretory pathway component PulF
VATGPTEPLSGQGTYWEKDAPTTGHVPAPASAKGSKSPAEMDLADYPSPQRSTPWRLSHMMYLVAGVAVFLWLVILVYDSILLVFFIMAGIIFAFAMVMGVGVIQARRRSTRQDSLLWVLAIASEHEMPLTPAVAACAEQYWGPAYARIMGLAARLNGGTMLPEALEQSRGVVSRDAVLLAWVGQESGKLPRALRMAATSRSTQLPIWTSIAARLSYILGVLLVMQTITSFILYFIMPKFESIFKDFGLSLPTVTIWVVDASHFLIKYGAITSVLLLAELGLLVFLPFSFMAWGNHNIPVLDRLLGRRHTALILRSLGLMVEGDKTIALALSTLANHYPTGWVRRRLRRVWIEVKEGADWIESLRQYRLIRASDADVLSSAAAVGNLAWALMELAETAERRLATRVQAFVQMLFPLMVVILGALVFVIGVAYFLPLVTVISRLSQQ